MKQINHRIFIAAIVVGGLFIGAVKGQDPNEVILDDYEIASYHNNWDFIRYLKYI